MNAIEYCEKNHVEYLIAEWDLKKNQDKRMEEVSYASHRKVWWLCEKGHTWQSTVKDRILRGRGCPYCANKRALRGFNDLQTVNPKLAEEWNLEKNRELKPSDITAGSDRKVWWRCALGHEWQASVENRSLRGNICPYCSGKKAWPGFNDLETMYPDVAKQWHSKLNHGLSPRNIRPGSGKRVWWQCEEGHVWQAAVFSRTSKKRPGCPVCAGNVRKANTALR